jgi:hypothetical protein
MFGSCKLCSLFLSTLQPSDRNYLGEESNLLCSATREQGYGALSIGRAVDLESMRSKLHIFEAKSRQGLTHFQVTTAGHISLAFQLFEG